MPSGPPDASVYFESRFKLGERACEMESPILANPCLVQTPLLTGAVKTWKSWNMFIDVLVEISRIGKQKGLHQCVYKSYSNFHLLFSRGFWIKWQRFSCLDGSWKQCCVMIKIILWWLTLDSSELSAKQEYCILQPWCLFRWLYCIRDRRNRSCLTVEQNSWYGNFLKLRIRSYTSLLQLDNSALWLWEISCGMRRGRVECIAPNS